MVLDGLDENSFTHSRTHTHTPPPPKQKKKNQHTCWGASAEVGLPGVHCTVKGLQEEGGQLRTQSAKN